MHGLHLLSLPPPIEGGTIAPILIGTKTSSINRTVGYRSDFSSEYKKKSPTQSYYQQIINIRNKKKNDPNYFIEKYERKKVLKTNVLTILKYVIVVKNK